MKQTKQTFSPHNRRVVGHSPVLFPASHALFIHRPVQLTLGWEDGLMVDDNCLNDLVNVGLAGHGVLVIWYWHQRRTKANGQIVGVHHVLVTVLRQTGGQAQSSRLAPASSEAKLVSRGGATGLTDSKTQTSISWRWWRAAEEPWWSAAADELFLRRSRALKQNGESVRNMQSLEYFSNSAQTKKKKRTLLKT